MNYYILRLKNEKHSRVDRIPASDLSEATEIYILRKQMNRETFNKLYEVTKDEQ
tara:strand:- start:173 stop:334 length:162 start_codon:yes stop_codon:yes gene_type:complete